MLQKWAESSPTEALTVMVSPSCMRNDMIWEAAELEVATTERERVVVVPPMEAVVVKVMEPPEDCPTRKIPCWNWREPKEATNTASVSGGHV